MKKLIKKTVSLTCLTGLLLGLTACGSKSGSDSKQDANTNAAQSATTEETIESAVVTDESVLTDGKTTSSAWKDGVLKINGKIFILSQTTLQQITESGYQAEASDMDYILYGEKNIYLCDNKHQEITLTTKNYSSDKPLYQKHALISGYTLNFKVENGLEATDAILPGNIKGGMTKDEIIAIMGTPETDEDYDDDNLLHYNFKEYGRTIYSVDFQMNEDTYLLENVTYNNSNEYANVTDDSNTILSSLDTNSDTTLTTNAEPSDSLKDAEIKIGSNVYTMPISMTDLSDLGYSCGVLDHILNPKETADDLDLSDKGGNTFYGCDFYNPSDRPRAYSHCLISALAITDKAENVSIAKGIRIGSTYKEVCAAFGKRDKSNVMFGDSDFALSYSYSAKRGKVTAVLFFKNNQVNEIQMSVKEEGTEEDDE